MIAASVRNPSRSELASGVLFDISGDAGGAPAGLLDVVIVANLAVQRIGGS
jgi:hypothetical protein